MLVWIEYHCRPTPAGKCAPCKLKLKHTHTHTHTHTHKHTHTPAHKHTHTHSSTHARDKLILGWPSHPPPLRAPPLMVVFSSRKYFYRTTHGKALIGGGRVRFRCQDQNTHTHPPSPTHTHTHTHTHTYTHREAYTGKHEARCKACDSVWRKKNYRLQVCNCIQTTKLAYLTENE